MNKSLTAALAATVFATGCGRSTPPAPPADAPVPKVLGSGIDKSHFDTAVRAQDDFYRSVNGGWLARTAIPADKTSYGAFDLVFDQAESQLREIIEAVAAAPNNAPGSEAQKVADLYAGFMDEKKLEELGLKPLDAELARIDALKDKAGLAPLVAHLHRIGVDAPFHISVGQDNRDSTQYIVNLSQSGLGLPDRDYYLLKDAKFTELRKLYLAHVQKVLTMLGAKNAQQTAKDILAFETRLADKQWTNVELRDPVKIYNKVEVANLAQTAPGFDWPVYLKEAGIGSGAVIVNEPSYFGALDGILSQASPDTLRGYLRLRLFDSYAGTLNKAAYDESFDFNGAKLNGVKQQKPRWKRGVGEVEGSIGEALGKLYVEKHFPAANKQRMQELVGNLIKAYDAGFDGLDWMGADTRKAAKAKLAKFMLKIGYPDKWRDYSKLEIKRDDLFGNAVRASEFEYQRNIDKLGKPIDRGEWGMTPQTVNAYYNPELNEIVFPAAILQPPFFDMSADDAMNYGAIGAVIGHEISHGFDDEGSQYDGDGNLRDWWSADDRAKFQAKAQALVAQYDAYEPVKGFHVKGALTLGENIADLGGVTIAYKAYQLSLGGKPAPVIDGLTADQRFFMGYAQAWMEKTRDEAMINQIKADPHSPPEFRTNGVVVNVPEFYTAFGVKEGDKMHQPAEKRVKIW